MADAAQRARVAQLQLCYLASMPKNGEWKTAEMWDDHCEAGHDFDGARVGHNCYLHVRRPCLVRATRRQSRLRLGGDAANRNAAAARLTTSLTLLKLAWQV